jgi:hypothetical protein
MFPPIYAISSVRMAVAVQFLQTASSRRRPSFYAESRNKGQKEKWILKHLPGFFDQLETSVVHRQRIPTPWPHNPKDISIVEKVFYVGSKA